MISGQYNIDALSEGAPDGYIKVCEGSTAVLFPPALLKGVQHSEQLTSSKNTEEKGISLHCSSSNLGKRNLDSKVENRDEDAQAVFYNPAQVVNRDLSVCALELFSRMRRTEPKRKGGTTTGITILEALSATGLRAIRYFKEITNVRYIIANDMDADAVKCIKVNCSFNHVPLSHPVLHANFDPSVLRCEAKEKELNGKSAESMRDLKFITNPTGTRNELDSPNGSPDDSSGSAVDDTAVYGAVIPNVDDAVDLMHRLALSPEVYKKRIAFVSREPSRSSSADIVFEPVLQQELMDVVDLDPYGSASPFLDGAFRCIKEGGMMLVTSTDSAVLCGNHMDTCHAKYSSVPYKASHCHDMAVRLLLCYAERVANKHRKYIVPLLSLHIDFYVRCFFRVYTQPAETKCSVSKLGYQLQCSNCPAFWLRPVALERPLRGKKKAGKRGREKEREEKSVLSGEQATARADLGLSSSNDQETHITSSTKNGEDVYFERFPTPPSSQSNPRFVCSTLSSLQCLTGIPLSTIISNPMEENLKGICSSSISPQHPAGTESNPTENTSMCPVCGRAVVISGPLYAAPIQNKEFLIQLLQVIKERAKENRLTAASRIQGLVQTAMEELSNCPLYYNLPDISSYVRVRCPPTPCFVGALGRLGYHCSQVHCEPSGIKTDCPPAVLFAVMLQWKALQDDEDSQSGQEERAPCSNYIESSEYSPVVDRKKKDSGPSSVPLLISPLVSANFSYDKKYDFRRDGTGMAKFIPNTPGWGPKRRHTGIATCTDEP